MIKIQSFIYENYNIKFTVKIFPKILINLDIYKFTARENIIYIYIYLIYLIFI